MEPGEELAGAVGRLAEAAEEEGELVGEQVQEVSLVGGCGHGSGQRWGPPERAPTGEGPRRLDMAAR